MITHAQLEALGYSGDAIKHRLRTGRLFRIHRGVYAVGRKELTQRGRWIDAGRPGAALRSVIERLTFRVTQSELEREFLRLVAKAELPLPDTQSRFGNQRVDFHWPEAGLVVETDGARFHANALQQQEDRRRDQAHIRAGRIPLRVTHWQVFREPADTAALLADVVTRLGWRAA